MLHHCIKVCFWAALWALGFAGTSRAATALERCGPGGQCIRTNYDSEKGATLMTLLDKNGKVQTSTFEGVVSDVQWDTTGKSLILSCSVQNSENGDVAILIDSDLQVQKRYRLRNGRAAVTGDGQYYFYFPCNNTINDTIYSFPDGRVYGVVPNGSASQSHQFVYLSDGEWLCTKNDAGMIRLALLSMPSGEVSWESPDLISGSLQYFGGEPLIYDRDALYLVVTPVSFEDGPAIIKVDRATGRRISSAAVGRGSYCELLAPENCPSLVVVDQFGNVQEFDKATMKVVGDVPADCAITFSYYVAIEVGSDTLAMTDRFVTGRGCGEREKYGSLMIDYGKPLGVSFTETAMHLDEAGLWVVNAQKD